METTKRVLLLCPICGRAKFQDDDEWVLIGFKLRLQFLKKTEKGEYEKHDVICQICREEENP